MLKSQDILVSLAINCTQAQKKQWKQLDIALDVGLSQAEVNNALTRLDHADLYRKESRQLNYANLKEFLFHGLKYVFPARLGTVTRGIPTAWGDQHVFKHIEASQVPVWAHIDGQVTGPSVDPIFKSAPRVYFTNQNLYHLLCALDSIRLGRARELKIAKAYIEKVLYEKR